MENINFINVGSMFHYFWKLLHVSGSYCIMYTIKMYLLPRTCWKIKLFKIYFWTVMRNWEKKKKKKQTNNNSTKKYKNPVTVPNALLQRYLWLTSYSGTQFPFCQVDALKWILLPYMQQKINNSLHSPENWILGHTATSHKEWSSVHLVPRTKHD